MQNSYNKTRVTDAAEVKRRISLLGPDKKKPQKTRLTQDISVGAPDAVHSATPRGRTGGGVSVGQLFRGQPLD